MAKIAETLEYQQHLTTVLKISKETELNGQVQKPINLADIAISIADICHRCGKSLNSTNSTEDSERPGSSVTKLGHTFCNSCANEASNSETEFAFSPEFDQESSGSSKRDSGFHTLKREESDKMDAEQQAESALSSASSADSAVLVECDGNVVDTTNTESKKTLPSIVIDLDNSDGQNGVDLSFSPNENVFLDNTKPHANGTAFIESPATLAEKLFNFKGYKRTEVADKLGANTEFSHRVGVEYLKFFNFSKYHLIEAYRDFLSRFALLGETQERERILNHFSQRYIDCNPDFIDGKSDSVHTLVCALTLLNTDLHGNVGLSSGRKKMTQKQFVSNLAGLMSDKSDYPKDLLSSLYSSVKKTPLPWGGKEQRKLPRSSSMRQNTETVLRPTPTRIVNRSLSTRTPLKVYKSTSNGSSSSGLGRSAKLKSLSQNQGLLWRKALLDSEGKKVSLGKRGWKVYTVNLQNLELHVAKRGSTEAKTISLHHSLAEESNNDSKRDHVFRLTLADTSITLYQASSEKETRKWIREINKAAGLLSAAPLCSPIGSQLVFRRPLLPSAPSTLPLINQFEKLQELLKEHEEDLENTLSCLETEKSRPEQLQYHEDKKAYLLFEIKKYKRYIKDLQILMRASSVMSDSSESNLGSTDNGSLVSVTPSEPPLASPMHRENFTFPDYTDPSELPPSSEPASAFSSPAHLVSPQHKNLTLSPTSSLPNLSPIMESPSKGSGNPASGTARRRQRKEKHLYESSLNDAIVSPEFSLGGDADVKDGTMTPVQGNTNNSNHASLFCPTPPRFNSPGTYDSLPRVRRLAGSSVFSYTSGQENMTPHGFTTTSLQRRAFSVKRYEMRVAEMETRSVQKGSEDGTEIRATAHPDATRIVTQSTPHAVPPHHSVFSSPVHEGSMLKMPHPLDTTPTLGRVKGRRERKGIERYSYMLAVGEREAS